MRTAALVVVLLLLSNQTSLADEPPSASQTTDVETLQPRPTTPADKAVTSKTTEKSQAASPNGKCTSRSGVPQVRALVQLPNERAQCAYFVA